MQQLAKKVEDLSNAQEIAFNSSNQKTLIIIVRIVKGRLYFLMLNPYVTPLYKFY